MSDNELLARIDERTQNIETNLKEFKDSVETHFNSIDVCFKDHSKQIEENREKTGKLNGKLWLLIGILTGSGVISGSTLGVIKLLGS